MAYANPLGEGRRYWYGLGEDRHGKTGKFTCRYSCIGLKIGSESSKIMTDKFDLHIPTYIFCPV
jgi:hypothetical protein